MDGSKHTDEGNPAREAGPLRSDYEQEQDYDYVSAPPNNQDPLTNNPRIAEALRHLMAMRETGRIPVSSSRREGLEDSTIPGPTSQSYQPAL